MSVPATKEYEVTAPAVIDFIDTAKVKRWYIAEHSTVKKGEKLVCLTDGFQGVQDVLSPADGVLEMIKIYANEQAPTGAVLGVLRVAADFVDTVERDWENFDKLSEIFGDFTIRSKDPKQLRDMNDALGELLGIKENSAFQRMNTQQQNQFIQTVVDQYTQQGLSPSVMARKLLEGLQLRTPQLAPSTPTPAYGLRPSAPGLSVPGLGGSGTSRPQTPVPTNQDQE